MIVMSTFLWGGPDQDQSDYGASMEADESVTRVDSSYSSLMYNDLNEFGSLILMHITPKERILKFKKQMSVVGMTGLDPDHLEGTHSY